MPDTGSGRERHSAYLRSIMPDPKARDVHDFYPTPPAATRALLSVETFEGLVWEPACGCGAMSTVLEDAGYEVLSTDLVDRGAAFFELDFLAEHGLVADNIVTNPPFKHAQAFACKALTISTRKVAIFARLMWLESDGRGAWFPTVPLARVWVFSDRVPFMRGRLPGPGEGARLMAFAWYVFDHAHSGPPALGWIRMGDFLETKDTTDD